jgi:(p)ppGpp synthase/HD superfamily hydrolase
MLSERFSNAAQFASDLHAGQCRKGTTIPYISHLFSVAALVLEDGGSEDEAIAALLHDAIEDQGRGNPDVLRQTITERFGDRVLEIVEALTDSDTSEKGPWRPRKEAYIARLASEPKETLRVAAADKLHNARAILSDYRVLGEKLWPRFSAGPQDIQWYYSKVERIIAQGLKTPLAARLHETVMELQGLRCSTL